MGDIFNGTASAISEVTYSGEDTSGSIVTDAPVKLLYIDGELVWHKHNWSEWEVVFPAECEIEGMEERTCSICQLDETKPIPAEDHSYNSSVTSPTCTDQGYTTYICDKCGKTYKANYTNATGHSWLNPLYLWEGYTGCNATRTCKNNTSHTESATATITSKITTPATCTTAGVRTYTATFSESWAAAQTKTESIAATGHSYGTPTYTWSGTSSCTATRVCSYDSSHKETATTTSITSAVTTEPTYTTTGVRTYTATFSESWAGTATKTETIAKLKYSITYDLTGCTLQAGSPTSIGVDDTLTADFLSATCYVMPDGLSALNAATTVTNAIGIWARTQNGTTVDGDIIYNYFLQLSNPTGNVTVKFACVQSHTSSDWIVTKAATTQSAGTRVKKCTVCGEVLETETIAKLDPFTFILIDETDQCYSVKATDTYLSGDITIPYGYNGYDVTAIADDAFKGCTGITSVTVPDSSIDTIGSNAFKGCTGLTSVTLEDGVNYINDSAFYGCTKLTSVNLGLNILEIGMNAFYNCSSLTSITIPNATRYIGTMAFEGCSALTDAAFKYRYWRVYTSSSQYIDLGSNGEGSYYLTSQFAAYVWCKFYAPVVALSFYSSANIITNVTIQNKNAVSLTAQVDATFAPTVLGTDSASGTVAANSTTTLTVNPGTDFNSATITAYFTELSSATATATIEGDGYAAEETTTTT